MTRIARLAASFCERGQVVSEHLPRSQRLAAKRERENANGLDS
jgi:hypothetical protein